jgi:plastocyanin
MRLPRATRAAPTIAALLLLLAACGGGDSDASTGDDGGTEASAGTGGGESAGAGGDQVELTGFAFSPGELTVAPGTTVTFVNNDTSPHTVTEGSDGTAADGARFDEEIAAGEEVTVTFDDAGTYEITCTLHPEMNMTVTVEG